MQVQKNIVQHKKKTIQLINFLNKLKIAHQTDLSKLFMQLVVIYT